MNAKDNNTPEPVSSRKGWRERRREVMKLTLSAILLFVTVWLRASLPRMRYDRLMALGWKYLIEIAILWVMVSTALVIGKELHWNPWITAPVAAAIALVAFLTLYLAIPKAGEHVEEFR